MGKLAFDWQFTSVEEVFEGFNTLEEKFYYIAILGPQKINVESLRQVLIQHIDMVDEIGVLGTNLRRLFRIYDYLAFGKHTQKINRQTINEKSRV